MVQVSHNSPISQEKSSQEIIKDFQEFSKTTISLLDTTLDMCLKYELVIPSQAFLAKKAGCVRETAQRLTDILHEKGYIIKIPRGKQEIDKHKDNTCEYRAASFMTKEVCKALSFFLKSFRFFNIKYLCSRAIMSGCQNKLPVDIKKNVTQVNSSLNNIYLNNPVVLSSCIRETGSESKKVTERKEDGMKSEQNILITPAIEQATLILGLTTHGKAKLRAFDDTAIQFALGKLQGIPRGINNKFEYVVNEAIKHSQEHRTGPTWRRYYSLRESYGIASDDKNFAAQEPKPLNNVRAAYIPKRNTSEFQRPIDPQADYWGKISTRRDIELKEKHRLDQEKRDAYWAEQDKLKLQCNEIIPEIMEEVFLNEDSDWEELPF